MRTMGILVFLLTLGNILTNCGGAHARLSADLVDASAAGDTAEVSRLLDAGAIVDVHARDDWTPLTIASREGHADVVQLLVKRGASVNLVEVGGHTALFWARKYAHSDVEKILLDAGAQYK